MLKPSVKLDLNRNKKFIGTCAFQEDPSEFLGNLDKMIEDLDSDKK